MDQNINDLEEYIIKDYLNKNVIITTHAVKRKIERSDISESEIKAWLKRIIEYYNKPENNYLKNGDKILIYSNKLQHGAVFHYRKDNKTGKLSFIMITFLDRGKKIPKQGTKFDIVEKYNEESFYNRNKKEVRLFSDNFFNFLTEVIEGIKKESKESFKFKKENNLNEGVVSIFESKIKNTNDKITLILIDGKYYDYYDIVLEEID